MTPEFPFSTTSLDEYMSSLTVIKISPNALPVSRSRFKVLVATIFYVLFFFVWYTSLIPEESTGFFVVALYKLIESHWQMVFFVFAPLLFVHHIYEVLHVLLIGRHYIFHTRKGLIYNDQNIASVSELEYVQLFECTDSESDCVNDSTFYLSIAIKSGEKQLDSSSDLSKISDIAEAIASHMGLEIVYK